MRSTIRRFVAATTVVLGSVSAARADGPVTGLGYGIGGLAGYTGFFGSNREALGHVAGGGEVLAGGMVGGGGEFGVMGGAGGLFFVTSANGVLHLVPSRPGRATSPFVTGGYTRLSSGEGSFNAWNIGAGADIWAREGVGVRIEFRDHVRPGSRGAVHYWSVRAGVAVR